MHDTMIEYCIIQEENLHLRDEQKFYNRLEKFETRDKRYPQDASILYPI